MVNNRLVIFPVWKAKKIAMDRYLQLVLDGVQHALNIWPDLKDQIYLGDEAFVSDMQKSIGNKKTI